MTDFMGDWCIPGEKEKRKTQNKYIRLKDAGKSVFILLVLSKRKLFENMLMS